MNAGVLVKICGLTRVEDALACAEAGADLLGFIFHPASRRNAEPAMVRSISRDLLGAAVHKVGVFVEQSADEVIALARKTELDFVQLHGDQDAAFCNAVGEALGTDRIIKVFWPERYASVAELQADLERFAPYCRFFLFDAGSSGGGHGMTFDAERIKGIVSPRSWLLAGGLGPDNVSEALLAEPNGVDMSSGVEASPGVKDMEKIRRVIRRVRSNAPVNLADAE